MEKEMYCRPWNAGLASETPAVQRRLARLIDALDSEINPNICEGTIVDEIRAFRRELVKNLEAEGWIVNYRGGNKPYVRVPK